MADRPGNPSLRRTAARAKTDRVVLPRAGNPDPVPDPPAEMWLGAHGVAWWRWAWTTPESTQWADHWQVARRASLEDAFADSGNRAATSAEMRQLEAQLGLTPKAKQALGWEMEPEQEEERTVPPAPGGGGRERVGSLERARQKRAERAS